MIFDILEKNLIVLIIVGILILIVLINFAVILIIKRKRRKRMHGKERKTNQREKEAGKKKTDPSKELKKAPAADKTEVLPELKALKKSETAPSRTKSDREERISRIKSINLNARELGFAPDVMAFDPSSDKKNEPEEEFDLLEQELESFKEGDIAVSDDTVFEDPVIRVEHVSMDFKREKDESSSVKELAIKTVKHKRKVEKFRALDDVSFTVYKGEVVGIIGTNGSGKSTILKIISGVLDPTEGSVMTNRGKIQLLTIGTGFDQELTGKENVYLNGAIIGYSKEFIDEKYDSIVKFAELEGFMEEKVKNYSSGMISRLGFAIATAEEAPEILILDEVLSVGDMFFQQKSLKRINEMIHGGSTVLIVSHSTGVIRNNCTKVVWIEKGHLRMVGKPRDVCSAYERMKR